MTMTSQQASGKRIATDRTRDGYGTAEVDGMLDDAEKSMHDPEETNADLRAELASANERLRAAEAELDRLRGGSDAGAEGQDTAKTASYSAARLLEIATRDADALVADARVEADQVVSQARAQAEQLIQDSEAEAAAREEEMSARAEEQRVELDQARNETMRELEGRRAELDAKVNRLAEFEHEYRDQLISYFNGQLETLHGPTIREAIAEPEDPQP